METTISYLALFLGNGAIIVTFIVALVANVFKEHQTAKKILLILAGLFCLGGLASNTYIQVRAINEKQAQEGKRQEIRTKLAQFIAIGDGFVANVFNHQLVLFADCLKWSNDVDVYLSEKVGQSYRVRFDNNYNVVSLNLNGVSQDQQDAYYYVHMRLEKLEQLSSEFPP